MTTSTNGHNGVHHAADEAIDTLYAWHPGLTPAPQPCPEACFSATVKGLLDGHETLLTARGQTPAEFKANLAAIRDLLDPVPVPPSQGQAEAWCAVHDCAMHLHHGKDGSAWFSHRLPEGGFCKGRK